MVQACVLVGQLSTINYDVDMAEKSHKHETTAILYFGLNEYYRYYTSMMH